MISSKTIALAAACVLTLGSAAFAQGGTDSGTTKTDANMRSQSGAAGTAGEMSNSSSAAGSKAPTASGGTKTGGESGGKPGTE